MNRRFCERMSTYGLVLVVALMINFFLPRAMPGNPLDDAGTAVGSTPVMACEETRKILRQYYGLEKTLGEQFRHYLTSLVRFDLGISIIHKEPVSHLLLERAPWTFFLTTSAVLVNICTVLPLGVRMGLRSGRDSGVLIPAVILESLPPFALAAILLVLFSVKLPLFPIGGVTIPFSESKGFSRIPDILHHAALPVLALSAQGFFSGLLVVRNSVKMANRDPCVLMAEIKGLSPRVIRFRYVLRLALLPIITFYALRVAFSAGGAILVEVVFAYPGLGQLTFEAVLNHDYPLLQGIFLVFTLWVLFINFCTDQLYLKLDPRIRHV